MENSSISCHQEQKIRCPYCSEEIFASAVKCRHCNTFLKQGGEPESNFGDSAGVRLLLPVGRSGLSITAGYVGLLAIIPIFAPVAIIMGILALRDLKKNPDKHGKGRAIFAIVMGCIFTLPGLLLLLLMLM